MLHLPPVQAAPIPFYIGTYTSRSGSKGVYEAMLDPQTGAISAPVLVARTKNPSYIALNPGGTYLYAVDESDKGSVSAFTVGLDGNLGLLNTQPLKGSAPCYVSVDHLGEWVFTASYVGGAVQCLPLLTSGSLGPATGTVINTGHGINPDRQEASHMHWIHADPKGKFVYSCDLGTDLVQCYKVNTSLGALERVATSDGHVPEGSGPRHGVWSADGKFFYVNGEMGDNVTVFAVNTKTGALTPKQTITTLPEGAHSVGSAEVEVHPNGHWLYVSNRGHDSMATFAIGRNGLLKQLQVAPAGVKTPRGFAIDPTGHWLVVAGQDSNDLTALPINQVNGNLGPPGPKTDLGSPVCIVFRRG